MLGFGVTSAQSVTTPPFATVATLVKGSTVMCCNVEGFGQQRLGKREREKNDSAWEIV